MRYINVLLAENPRKSFRIFDMNKEVQIVSTPNLFIWQDKQGEYGQKISSFKKLDTVSVFRNYLYSKGLERYVPSFGTSTSTAKVMALYNQQGQGSDNLCWAASVATIVNYIYGTSYTAKDVADAQGIAYSSGGTIYTKQTALDYYSKVFIVWNVFPIW